MGLPVRVMCTSEMVRRCSALLAILGAVDRTAVGREAIVAGVGCAIPGGREGRRRSQLTLTVGGCELRFAQFQFAHDAARRLRNPPVQRGPTLPGSGAPRRRLEPIRRRDSTRTALGQKVQR